MAEPKQNRQITRRIFLGRAKTYLGYSIQLPYSQPTPAASRRIPPHLATQQSGDLQNVLAASRLQASTLCVGIDTCPTI